MNSYLDKILYLLYQYDDSFKQINLTQIKNTSGYDTIVISSDMTAYRPKVEGALFARIKETGKNPYISFKSRYRYWFDDRTIPTYSTKSEADFIRLSPLDFMSVMNQYGADFGKLAAKICLDSMSFPRFGCCSRYELCSAAGKCLHDDLLYSSACEYRRNLEAGKVFYAVEGCHNE